MDCSAHLENDVVGERLHVDQLRQQRHDLRQLVVQLQRRAVLRAVRASTLRLVVARIPRCGTKTKFT